MDPFDQNIDRSIDLSQQIVALGKQGEWDKVQALDSERLCLLQAVFSDKAFAAQREKYRERIETLLRLNEAAVAVCAQARSDNMASSRAVKRGSHAISAYRKQSGGD